jgi:hypothetical protein
MLQLENRPWLFQVLDCVIDPAQEPAPFIQRQIRNCGHPSLRMTHHQFCPVNLPFDV